MVRHKTYLLRLQCAESHTDPEVEFVQETQCFQACHCQEAIKHVKALLVGEAAPPLL